MSVNGVKIKVGQRWMCRDGMKRNVVECIPRSEWPFVMMSDNGDECMVNESGEYATDGVSESDFDLICLVESVVVGGNELVIQDVVEQSTQRKHSHYHKDVSHLKTIDVYRVLDLFEVSDPCIQHAIKKLLCAGVRGVKDVEKDYREAVDSVNRALQMIAEDGNAKAD